VHPLQVHHLEFFRVVPGVTLLLQLIALLVEVLQPQLQRRVECLERVVMDVHVQVQLVQLLQQHQIVQPVDQLEILQQV
jgi:hypothetical protein